jgi:succinate dehydrogenase/fumarate reductase-like Fe-S protein
MSVALHLYIDDQKQNWNWHRQKYALVYRTLMSCIECLSCTANCPYFNRNQSSFGGPFMFVKLAQLYFHPGNKIDRAAQARAYGIELCKTCKKCHCIKEVSIPIFKYAIEPLLTSGTEFEIEPT